MPMSWGTDGEEEQDHCRIPEEFLRWAERREIMLDLTQPTASHHLGILERSGLVLSRREGKWVFYKIADAKVEILLTKGSQLIEGSL